MKILAIDTSSKIFSLAVSDGDKILRSKNVHLEKVLSSSIIPGIAGILKSAKLDIHDLDGFAVGLGPGSFTSLRVGLSTVKGLSFATGRPVVGIASLDTVAMNINGENALPVCALNDARRNMVYACHYKKGSGRMLRKSDYMLLGIEALLKQCDTPVMFIGDGIPLFKDEIIKDFRQKKIQPHFAKEADWHPDARNLARLALVRFRKKNYDNINKLVPLYLYPADCQVRS